jgi:hypothetical protein
LHFIAIPFVPLASLLGRGALSLRPNNAILTVLAAPPGSVVLSI